MSVLVVGGAGYIGSHTVRALLGKGYRVIVLDSLVTGHRESLPKDVKFHQADLADREALSKAFREDEIDMVVHFAAFIEAGESMTDPRRFYRNNVANTINLLDVMLDSGVTKIVFSSTAALFGVPETIPIAEEAEKVPVNVYGRTKLMVETILRDYDSAYGLKSLCLRYFNASGAGYDIGEDHRPETHLVPLVLRVAQGKAKDVKVFGTDYPTADGTCVRDYIHVLDLAEAHVRAVQRLADTGASDQFNLGNGKGYSVKEVVDAARRVTGQSIPVIETARRPGDPPVLIADSSKIRTDLGWVPQFDLDEIVASAWQWHSCNPEGFG
jgi:UDP-glucose 4-epimerase